MFTANNSCEPAKTKAERAPGRTKSKAETAERVQAGPAIFEPRFGQDFSAVRMHADSQAADAARRVAARAFTVGEHVVFGDGDYAPETATGRHLLAHELTHVVQQRSSTGQHQQAVVQREVEPPDPTERLAGHSGLRVPTGRTSPRAWRHLAGHAQRLLPVRGNGRGCPQ